MHDRPKIISDQKSVASLKTLFNWPVVVWGVEIIKPLGVDSIEVMFHPLYNIFAEDLDKIISINMVMHVIVSQSMKCLVNCNSFRQTAVLNAHRQFLTTAKPPKPRPTSVSIYYFNKINLVGSVYESNASVALDDLKFVQHPVDLGLCWEYFYFNKFELEIFLQLTEALWSLNSIWNSYEALQVHWPSELCRNPPRWRRGTFGLEQSLLLIC